MSIEKGVLYVVATPIGNLGDMSPRAVAVLSGVDRIAAEDTRHSGQLLKHFGIGTPCTALHEHNEEAQAGRLVDGLCGGASLALISDAGTPLVSDPGFRLVRLARERGVKVVPVPGPSAFVAALSAAGLPSDRFVFEGFLPARHGARRTRLEQLAAETRTLIFYESPHRIVEALQDMAAVFGAQRQAVYARELTKTFETLKGDALTSLAAWVEGDPHQQKGEIVVLVHGAEQTDGQPGVLTEARRILEILLQDLPVKQAANLAAQITGGKRNDVYKLALTLAGDKASDS